MRPGRVDKGDHGRDEKACAADEPQDRHNAEMLGPCGRITWKRESMAGRKKLENYLALPYPRAPGVNVGPGLYLVCTRVMQL